MKSKSIIEYLRRAAAAVLCAVSAAAAGCITNDIPYPVVECRIESIAAEGLISEPQIDYQARRVTLPLAETTDIQNVRITDVRLSSGAQASAPLTGTFDLRGPMQVTLSLYQDYEWEIAASQNIVRTFAVAGQIGATVWDYTDRTARAYVATDDLSDIAVKSLKLGPAGITRMSCAGVSDFDETSDFSEERFRTLRDFDGTYRQISVTCHDRTEEWILYVEHTDVAVDFTRADGWVRTAWFYAEGLSGARLGFRYRRVGDVEWQEVAQDDMTIDGGAFSARVRGLEPETDYEAVAYSDDDESAVVTFTTQPELPLPNSGFEEWVTLNKILHPYLSSDTAFWDSGNQGAATAGETLTEGSADIRPGSAGRSSASLTSKYANLAGIGKFAAGNIFIGTYAQTVGTNGKVNFGRPFTSRPVALRGWLKFENGKIDHIGDQPDGMTLTKDDADEGSIYIAVGTWTAAEYGGTDESPVQVYTKRDERTLFDPTSKDVVGYGELILREPVGEWREFEIELDYRSTDVVPTHLIIVCSASRWGDYFTGSTRNRMWLDDFELVW